MLIRLLFATYKRSSSSTDRTCWQRDPFARFACQRVRDKRVTPGEVRSFIRAQEAPGIAIHRDNYAYSPNVVAHLRFEFYIASAMIRHDMRVFLSWK